MKENRILYALSEVQDEFVEDMDIDFINQKIDKQIVKRKSWIKWISAAAVLVLLLSVVTEMFTPEETSKNYFSASMTSGMIILEKKEPLLTKNPYLMGMPVMEYPVYKNLSYLEGAGGEPHYYTEEELYGMAVDIAEKLETRITDCTYSVNDNSDIETRSAAYEITAQTELAEIRILGNGQITISFYQSIALPEEYHFSDNNSYVEAMQLIRYLAEEYNSLFDFENAADDCQIEYDIEGNRKLFYTAYNVATEEPEAITEYCFNNVRFYGDQDGLSMIRYGDVRGASEYMGNYLVISEEEARIRLEAGEYFSIYSELDAIGGEFSDENIKMVELMYLTGSNCMYYQPYYCFYVESESYMDGISNYSLFFVPALMDEDLAVFGEVYPLGN